MIPSPENAVGIVREIAKNAVIPASSGRRRAVRSGGTALVSQAKAAYIHQIEVSIRTIWARLWPFGALASRAVSWVIVKTKTRSKKSSIDETRTSPSACAAAAAVSAIQLEITPRVGPSGRLLAPAPYPDSADSPVRSR